MIPKQTQFNLITDASAALSFAVSAVSGLVILYMFPRPARGFIFIFEKEVWSRIHTASSLMLIVFVIIHVLLHIRWIKVCYQLLITQKGGVKNNEQSC